MRTRDVRSIAGLALFAIVTACEANGELSVLVEPEDPIVDGIEPGDGPGNMRDGWRADFARYLLAIGDVELRRADVSGSVHADDVFVVDLTALPAAGEERWLMGGLAAGRWEVFYETPGAGGATAHASVEGADFELMRSEDLTYLVVGTLSKADGTSCPPVALATPPGGAMPVGQNAGGDDCYASPTVSFALGVPAPTRFGPCEVDGIPGVNVPRGGTQTLALTIHGDHLFFNGFPEGDESGTMRLAQWLADCDLDLDGEVTREELSALAPSDLPELDDRFQLGGSPITPLDSLWTYVAAQLSTQGHVQGEGECPIDRVG